MVGVKHPGAVGCGVKGAHPCALKGSVTVAVEYSVWSGPMILDWTVSAGHPELGLGCKSQPRGRAKHRG